MEEDIVTQIGLLLSQLRYARRALEDIERSTARYGGVTFAVALAAGPRFGEPPMMSGALKVYVANISDLTISRGGVGLLEGLLGGIGRFFGGLAGGFAGGIIGGISLWVWVGKLQDIVKGINDILDRLGIRGGATGGTPGEKDKPEKGTDWVAAIERLKPMLDSLSTLFDAAARGPKDAGKTAADDGVSDQARGWGEQLAIMLTAATDALNALDKVVKALTGFVPILIGALATLLVRLDDIKLAIVDLLQFALRITLLVRGAALVTIYDTVSALAKLGVSILGILKDAAKTILDAVLAIIGTVLGTIEAFIKFAGSGLKKAMDGLLEWLVSGLGRVLTYIGDLRIFRLLTHLVQVLPSMLPALVTLVHGNDASISATGMQWLEDIRGKKIPGPTGAALTGKLPKEVKFPDLGKKFLEDVAPFKKSLEDANTQLPAKTKEAFEAGQKGLGKIDELMQKALRTGEPDFQKKLSEDLKKVSDQATERAKELAVGIKAADQFGVKPGDDGGLRAIAKPYEEWLSGKGLKQVLDQVSEYFATAKPTDPPTGAAAVPSAAINTARPEQPRATVEIGEIIIDLKPTKPDSGSKPKLTKPLSLLHEGHPPGYDEMIERGA